VKGLTLALGALVATTAAVYLNSGNISDEADLVAPRPERTVQIESTVEGSDNASKQGSSTVEGALPSDFELRDRDSEASRAKMNLFRALEIPPAVKVAVEAPPTVVASKPVVAPRPTFVFLGSFKEGSDLQAILEVGEAIEFAKPTQTIAGFRIDSVDSDALRWTHEATSTSGRLQARAAK
jgi:hypothetical protein